VLSYHIGKVNSWGVALLSVVCTKPGSLAIEDRPRPSRAENEVLIRIRRVGVCGTDFHIFRGKQPYLSYPRLIGHEFSGEVAEAAPNSGFASGDRVAVIPYLSCGVCIACRRGKTNCCTRLEVLGVHRDGALTEYLAVPAEFVINTNGLSFDDAAMIEFLSIGAHAARRAEVAAAERVLVVGAGPIGLAATAFCKLRGAEVTVVDSRQDRLEFSRAALSADHRVPLSGDTQEALASLTGGEFFDVVFDATGNPQAMETGFGYVAHGGRYALISVVSADMRFSDPEFHKRETTLFACRNATLEDFGTVIDAMLAGKIPTAAFGTHRSTLSAVPETLPRWADPASGVIKAIVEI
jgi:2-desacetyl-2-hydroxyethyl bacteriochlorophyllide A dehydrogenase